MNIKHSVNKFIKRNSWDLIIFIFRIFNKLSPYFHYPVICPMLKRLADLEPDAYTQGYALNLNASLTDSGWCIKIGYLPCNHLNLQSGYGSISNSGTPPDSAQGVVMPIDMMKQAAVQSNYRAIMNKCLCGSAYSCKNFR